MTALYNMLKEIGIEAERKVKSELSGSSGKLRALLYDILMPLVLNFQTEEESYHFIFQKGGTVSLHSGLHTNPDVKIYGEHAELLYLLQNRDKGGFKHAERTRRIKVIARTFKGMQAVAKLRGMFL